MIGSRPRPPRPRHRFGAWFAAVLAATSILVTLGCDGGRLSPAELLQRGQYLSDAQRPAEAISVFDQLIESQPANAQALYLRGLAHERTGDGERALSDYDAAIAANPGYVEAYNNRAVLHAQNGRFEAAIADFTHVLKQSPKFVLGFKNRGLAYHDTGDFAAAMDDFDRAIQLSPDAQGYFMRGNLHLEQKQYAVAIADYDKSLGLDDSNSRGWLNRGMALARLGKTNEARESLQQASQMDHEIVSQEIVLAMRSLALDPSVGLDVELVDVQQAIDAQGWKATRGEEPHFPFTIEKQGQQRKLFVALLDVDQESIAIAAAAQPAVLDESIPKSLLIATDSGLQGGQWRFIEDWQPTSEQVSVATLKVVVDPTP
ncbi:Lipoprotein NlpI precursor [Rosistilla ulvae]|uniref:Lipoprotein NlpI n=1 Tax=Rosistilla ulvae TaxID=1930277 RepID=A0A517M5E6_9BACT|nr:tetratricopeptide repeat protein [Rosistilla ulvae]QDS90095.1 Lipoprotein NlpI precursor [Rosistilla ulvae]